MIKSNPVPVFQLASFSSIIALSTSMTWAQSITISGQNATYADGCIIYDAPADCASEVITPISPLAPNPSSPWNLSTAYNTGLIVGTNYTKTENGPAASGMVSVKDGAYVESAYIYLGLEENTEGKIDLSGPGTLWNGASALVVGKHGKGVFNVSDGAKYEQLNPDHMYIGYGKNADGLVVVDGVGANGERSTIYTKNRILIGNLGKAELRILNGGFVSGMYTLFTGTYEGSEGSVLIDGVHTPTGFRSTLTTENNNIKFGESGTGRLSISNGGLLKIPNAVILGDAPGSTGVAYVDGVHAETGFKSEINAELLWIGGNGSGEVNISNGGGASGSGPVYIGIYRQGKGVVDVSGSDAASGHQSSLEFPNVYVGWIGNGKLNVSNGAKVHATDQIFIGGIPGTSSNIDSNKGAVGLMQVDGINSIATAENGTTVGTYGTGTLNIARGGKLVTPVVNLATRESGLGTLNIGMGESAGILEATKVEGGLGKAQVNFNHVENIDFSPSLTGSINLNHLNAGKTQLTAINDYSGETRVAAGILSAGAAGAFSKNSDFIVGTGSALSLNGYDQTIKRLDNAGAISLGSNAGTILTVSGDYIGGGGVVNINTVLGDDSSKTDKIVVKGNSLGQSDLVVNNQNGLGAPTQEGIEIVNVQGGGQGKFKLIGHYTKDEKDTIVAGAYAYQLHQGNQSGTDSSSWYLRSELNPEPAPDPAPSSPQTPPVTPPKPASPLYQAGVPVYEAYPQLLLGLSELPTWQQRVSNRYWSQSANRQVAGTTASEGTLSFGGVGPLVEGGGVWGRMAGQHSKIKPRTSSSAADYDYDSFTLQLGVDRALKDTQSGRLVGGLNARYVHGKAHVDSDHGKGNIKSSGYGVGATLTWYGDNNVYVDNQAQVSWYDSDLHSKTAGRSLVDGNRGWGYAVSSELGKRFAFNENWSVTPNAQLSYTNARFNSFQDAFGAEVSRDKADSLALRLAANVQYQNAWTGKNGKISRSSVYTTLFLQNEFLNGSKVNVGGVTFTQKPERLWAGLGVGGTYNWDNDKYSLYGELALKSSVKNFGDSYGYSGTVGVRVRW